MFGRLRAALGLAGSGESPVVPAVDYKGYRILPAPYLNKSAYQTAGAIEKDTPEGVKRHEFVRADTYDSHEDAVSFTITKAQQIIDHQGDKLFK